LDWQKTAGATNASMVSKRKAQAARFKIVSDKIGLTPEKPFLRQARAGRAKTS